MLSKAELEIMQVLWTEQKSLTTTEIVDLCSEKTWKPKTIHFLIKGLMEKGVIAVDGMRPTGKVYARTFSAAVSREEYATALLEESMPKDERQLSGIFSALVSKQKVSRKTLDELQAIIDAKKKELNE